jgi:hypothetical protein
MKKTQQHRGEAFRRVQQFLDAHPQEFGPVNESEARFTLDQSVIALDAAVRAQLVAFRDVRGERRRQTTLESELRTRHVQPIATFARGRLQGTPNVAALTPSVSRLSGVQLVNAARAMAKTAEGRVAEFAAAAFPGSFVQELVDAAAAVETAIDARRRRRAELVNATAGVEGALRGARSAALMIEGAVGRIVPRGSPLDAEWRSVKRVLVTAVRSRTDNDAVAGSITPATTATSITATQEAAA